MHEWLLHATRTALIEAQQKKYLTNYIEFSSYNRYMAVKPLMGTGSLMHKVSLETVILTIRRYHGV